MLVLSFNIYVYILFGGGGGRGMGKGLHCGNVPVENNANRFLSEKANLPIFFIMVEVTAPT